MALQTGSFRVSCCHGNDAYHSILIDIFLCSNHVAVMDSFSGCVEVAFCVECIYLGRPNQYNHLWNDNNVLIVIWEKVENVYF